MSTSGSARHSNSADLHASSSNPAFKPLFAIIADDKASVSHRSSLTTPVHHNHPHVYYLFSDDADRSGDDVLTSALLDTLSASSGRDQRVEGVDRKTSDDHGESDVVTSREDVGKERQERYVIIDMAPDGKSIVHAKSLSRDWQVLKAEVKPAPSFNSNGDDGDAGKAGGNDSGATAASMLWIEGMEVNRAETGAENEGQRDVDAEQPLQKLERLREEFEAEMEVLKGWIGRDETSATE
ncbi:MAG: hypothetical protein M1828_000239 [Chrysothrix sp. TS-e1954]|nr:MAG: hypothetical protein M1828_000239 [Chrysothrix sp. TS-e1954]